MLAYPSSSRPLSIAFFIEGMSASGVDTSTQLLATQLRQLGHRVTLFVPWKDHEASDVYCLPSLRVSPHQAVYWTWPLHLPLFEQFQRAQFDLIHVHTNTVINLLAWQMAKRFQLPIVYTYHTMATEYAHYLGPIHQFMGGWVENTIELYDRLICQRAAAVTTPSHKAAHYLRKIGVPAPLVLPNGIDLRRFAPSASAASHLPAAQSTPAQGNLLRQRFQIPAEAKVLLFVGRLNHEKRPLLAYDCFRRLQQRRQDVHLVMVGEGALRQQLTDRVAADGLTGKVHLTGLVAYHQMPAIYNAADIWISTSCSEVHPMVAIESGACGLPAVALRDEALAGVVEPQVNGFIVDEVQEFVEALDTLLNDPVLRSQMGKNAVQQMQRFRIENTARAFEAVYHQVVRRDKAQAFRFHLPRLWRKPEAQLRQRLA